MYNTDCTREYVISMHLFACAIINRAQITQDCYQNPHSLITHRLNCNKCIFGNTLWTFNSLHLLYGHSLEGLIRFILLLSFRTIKMISCTARILFWVEPRKRRQKRKPWRQERYLHSLFWSSFSFYFCGCICFDLFLLVLGDRAMAGKEKAKAKKREEINSKIILIILD